MIAFSPYKRRSMWRLDKQSIKIDNKRCILPMETNEKTIKHHMLLSRAIKVFDVPDRVMIKDWVVNKFLKRMEAEEDSINPL